MSKDTSAPVRVNIYGREYAIRGEGDGNYIAEIAHYVDMKMREMTDNMAMASTAKVAILAALNITDELYQKDQQLRELEEGHLLTLSGLAERIEAELEEEEDELLPEEELSTQTEPASSSGSPLRPASRASTSGDSTEED